MSSEIHPSNIIPTIIKGRGETLITLKFAKNGALVNPTGGTVQGLNATLSQKYLVLKQGGKVKKWPQRTDEAINQEDMGGGR